MMRTLWFVPRGIVSTWMGIRYAHTHLIAHNGERLATFHVRVFGCELVPPTKRASSRNPSVFRTEQGLGTLRFKWMTSTPFSPRS